MLQISFLGWPADPQNRETIWHGVISARQNLRKVRAVIFQNISHFTVKYASCQKAESGHLLDLFHWVGHSKDGPKSAKYMALGDIYYFISYSTLWVTGKFLSKARDAITLHCTITLSTMYSTCETVRWAQGNLNITCCVASLVWCHWFVCLCMSFFPHKNVSIDPGVGICAHFIPKMFLCAATFNWGCKC